MADYRYLGMAHFDKQCYSVCHLEQCFEVYAGFRDQYYGKPDADRHGSPCAYNSWGISFGDGVAWNGYFSDRGCASWYWGAIDTDKEPRGISASKKNSLNLEK